MKSSVLYWSFFVVVCMAAACDFPADPAKARKEPVVPTEDVLVPLRVARPWFYSIYKTSTKELRARVFDYLGEETYGSEMYYTLHLLYRNEATEPPRETYFLPSLMRNLPDGLAFYGDFQAPPNPSPTQPEHLFTLPYPAVPGYSFKATDSSYYSVMVVAKDTIVFDVANEISARTYRYDLRKGVNDFVIAHIYVVPGKGIFRIESLDTGYTLVVDAMSPFKR